MILLVEDNTYTRRAVKRVLVSAGFPVLEVDNATDALESIDERVSLIITDIALPGLDGVEMLPLIRAQSGIPVVALTGIIDDRVRAAGFDVLLEKPVPPTVLLGAVRQLLGK